ALAGPHGRPRRPPNKGGAKRLRFEPIARRRRVGAAEDAPGVVRKGARASHRGAHHAPAARHGIRTARPEAVSIPGDLAVDACAARACLLERFEEEQTAALAQHDAVPPPVERRAELLPSLAARERARSREAP